MNSFATTILCSREPGGEVLLLRKCIDDDIHWSFNMPYVTQWQQNRLCQD